MSMEIFEEYGDNPVSLYKKWYREAQQTEINDPDAVCLATSDAQGKPSARMVLIKDIREDGLCFYTNSKSRKGQELIANPYAALCIYWKSTRKQIRVEGNIKLLSDADSDSYFQSRGREKQIGAWASQQSRSFENKADLNDAVNNYTKKFENQNTIPRPDYWQGFLLQPHSFEFWIGHKDRLHTRFIYSLENDHWKTSWLYP